MPLGYIRGVPDKSWWMTQINAGIVARKKYAHETQWSIWRDYYRGNWRGDILPVNLFFKMLRSTVPRVYFRNPSVSVISRRPGADALARAKIIERIDNKMLKRMKVKNHIKQIVQDGFMFGTGIGKLGFGAEFTPTPDAEGTDSPIISNKYKVEYTSTVEANMPWFARVPTGSFIVPHDAITLDDARWVAHWVRRPLQDVKEDPRLKHTKDLAASSKGSEQTNIVPHSTLSGTIDMVDLIEVRDKKTGLVFILAPYSSDSILYRGEDEMQINGRVPFYSVQFNPDDEVFWGVPDAHILEPQQLEINEIRTQMMKHRRLSIIKVLAQRNKITEEEAAKMVSEDVNAVVWTEDDPNMGIKLAQASQIPPDLLLAEEAIMRDVRENLGFSRNEAGEFQGGSRKPTAAEVNVVRRASEIRVDERRDMLADMLVDMVGDMHHVIFNEWGTEEIIDVAGPDGAPVWVRFRGDMLRSGRYEVNIDPDTSVPETRDVRRQTASEAYTILKENPLIDPDKLTRYFLNELGNVAFDDLMKPGGLGSQQNPMDFGQFSQLFQGAQGVGML